MVTQSALLSPRFVKATIDRLAALTVVSCWQNGVESQVARHLYDCIF